MESRPLLELLALAEQRKQVDSQSAQLASSSPTFLAVARESAGISQAKLASHAGVSRAYLNQMESGARAVSTPLLEKLSQTIAELAATTTSTEVDANGNQNESGT